MNKEKIKEIVRESYAKVAVKNDSCCGPAHTCSPTANRARDISKKIGYSEKELASIPDGANLGLGCGNPVAIASLRRGDTVLDLGSGTGLDCFLAAEKVGRHGKVIGVDMTPEMIEKARENAKKADYVNIEFRQGEIEDLPVADDSIDVVISNCVINLSPDKEAVFREIFRVLKTGKKMIVSDIVLSRELPAVLRESIDAYVGCISGAIRKEKYIEAMKSAGFRDIDIIGEAGIPVEEWINDPIARAITEKLRISAEEAREILASVISVTVKAEKKG